MDFYSYFRSLYGFRLFCFFIFLFGYILRVCPQYKREPYPNKKNLTYRGRSNTKKYGFQICFLLTPNHLKLKNISIFILYARSINSQLLKRVIFSVDGLRAGGAVWRKIRC